MLTAERTNAILAAAARLGLTHHASVGAYDADRCLDDLRARRVAFVAVRTTNARGAFETLEVFASAKPARIYHSRQRSAADVALMLGAYLNLRDADDVLLSADVLRAVALTPSLSADRLVPAGRERA